MGCVIIGDMHLTDRNPASRANDIHEEQKANIDFLLDFFYEREVQSVVQLGDFFDKPRVSNKVYRLASRFISSGYYPENKYYGIVGQHDMFRHDPFSVYEESHFGLLMDDAQPRERYFTTEYRVEQIKVTKDKTLFAGFLPYNCDLYEAVLYEGYSFEYDDDMVLFTHAPVHTEPMPYVKHPDELNISKKIKHIFFGDIHKPFKAYKNKKGQSFYGLGTMTRMNYGERDIDTGFLYTEDFVEFERISFPHKGVFTHSTSADANVVKDSYTLQEFKAKLKEAKEYSNMSDKDLIKSVAKKHKYDEDVVRLVLQNVEEE